MQVCVCTQLLIKEVITAFVCEVIFLQKRKPLTTLRDVTVVKKLSGICGVAPGTVDIIVRVATILKKDSV